jgi:hypothetical protein
MRLVLKIGQDFSGQNERPREGPLAATGVTVALWG